MKERFEGVQTAVLTEYGPHRRQISDIRKQLKERRRVQW